MWKKIILFVFLYVGVFSCCQEPPEYWEMQDVWVGVSPPLGQQFVNGTFAGDSLFIGVGFNGYPTHASNDWEFTTMTSAYGGGHYCDKGGDLGLINYIVEFEVVSNHRFNKIPAGQPLNPILTVDGRPLNDVIAESSTWAYEDGADGYSMRIKLPGRPEGFFKHTFTVRMTTADRKIIEKETLPIIW